MSKAIDMATLTPVIGTLYPLPFDGLCFSRGRTKLGDAAGLTQFGVNLLRLPSGPWSSQRLWQTASDEFVFVLSGEVTLVTDAGPELLRAGAGAGFRAGDPDGHCLQNRSDADAPVLEIGTRVPGDGAYYSDIDMVAPPGGKPAAGSEAGAGVYAVPAQSSEKEAAFELAAKLFLEVPGSLEEAKFAASLPVIKSACEPLLADMASSQESDSMSDAEWRVTPRGFFGPDFLKASFDAADYFNIFDFDPNALAGLDSLARRPKRFSRTRRASPRHWTTVTIRRGPRDRFVRFRGAEGLRAHFFARASTALERPWMSTAAGSKEPPIHSSLSACSSWSGSAVASRNSR